jgi:hypothetical protein
MLLLASGPPIGPKQEAAHRCGNGHLGCIHPKHLRWATRQQNSDDKKLHGTILFGEKNPSAKLSADIVRKIRQSSDTLQFWSDRLDVSKATVGDARSGRTWGHVK